jgi:hypothetical protein
LWKVKEEVAVVVGWGEGWAVGVEEMAVVVGWGEGWAVGKVVGLEGEVAVVEEEGWEVVEREAVLHMQAAGR